MRFFNTLIDLDFSSSVLRSDDIVAMSEVVVDMVWYEKIQYRHNMRKFLKYIHILIHCKVQSLKFHDKTLIRLLN